jgi:hypothetical protein
LICTELLLLDGLSGLNKKALQGRAFVESEGEIIKMYSIDIQ